MKLNLKKSPSEWLFTTANETGAEVQLEASPKYGGKGKFLRPMENLLASLASCASIDVLIILQKQKIEAEDYQVDIEADRKEEVPGNFESIRLVFKARPTFELQKFERAVELAMTKYCSVALSLDTNINLSWSVHFNPENNDI